MNGVPLNPILERIFRSNPAYELAPFDRLPPDQQILLKDLTNDPDFYGVLLPRAPGGPGIKSVCRNTALLLHSMIEPGPLPRPMQHSADDDANQEVAELVLDGVLQIEHTGRFVSGSEAYPLIYAGHPVSEPQGLLPRLSRAALEYAQALEIDDVNSLSARLYFYNRIPLTPYWSQRLASEYAVSRFLGTRDSVSLQYLSRDWSPVEHLVPDNAWLLWNSRCSSRPGRNRGHGYKLYVSPQPDDLPAAFGAVIEILDNTAVYAFKVGSNPIGILRPDKFILYFRDFAALEQTAGEIARALSGCVAQGVPFTAAISGDGLLSWGVDPLPETGALSWQGPESWRIWVTNRLAAALVSARANCPGTLQPWQFALDRLRLEDVDTDTWAPTATFGALTV